MGLLKTIDVDRLWQQEQGWDSDRKSGRKFDDEEELAFWVKAAPTYSDHFNLYRDLPPLREMVNELAVPDARIMDVGCGSGNFAIPLAERCKEVMGIDFSPDMLEQLEMKKEKNHLHNIKVICEKWEDFSGPWQADYVIAINSLYRCCYMKEALEKINRYAGKGFLLGRTILKPFLSEIYKELHVNYKRNNDYMLMPLFLWDMGIDAKVDFYSYPNVRIYESWDEAESEILQNIGELSYLNYSDLLKESFMKRAVKEGGGYRYSYFKDVEVITYRKG